MRKKIHKIFFAWDFEKEEQWLNEMAAKGLCLMHVGFCSYTFEESLPGEYSIRLELLEHVWNHPESERYIAFLEETGAELVGFCLRWVYFRKKKEIGEFELFSDYTSRLHHLTRIVQLIAIIGGANLLIGASNLLQFFLHFNSAGVCGAVNILLSIFCAWGCWRLLKKRKTLKQEQQLFE